MLQTYFYLEFKTFYQGVESDALSDMKNGCQLICVIILRVLTLNVTLLSVKMPP